MCSDFIDDWVKIGLPAKAKVKREHPDLSFEQQTAICERVRKHQLQIWRQLLYIFF